jgi:hypothetical protein
MSILSTVPIFYYSGWPSENSIYDCSTQKGKRRFLKDMEKFEGIKLSAEEIHYNDALRSEAKLAMNSYVSRFLLFIVKFISFIPL